MSTTIIAEKMVFGGDCLAKIDGKNVFVPYAVPGEKLEIETVESRKDYDIAKIVNIVEPSPKRITPECPYYQKCGGCNLMHIDYDFQVELRKKILSDCFEKYRIEIPEIECVTSQNTLYRSRFQLHDGALEERHSNEKIYIDHCVIADEAVNAYFASVKATDRPKGRCHIFGSKCAEPELSVSIPHEKNREEKKGGKNNKKLKHYIRPKYAGNIIDPSTCVTVNILDKKLSFDVQGFFQSNIKMLEKTVKLVTDGLSGQNVLDMYSGCGTFSVFLEDKFNHLTLVEHNRAALVFAEQNLKLKNHDSYGLSGEKWVKENAESVIKQNGPFDAVVIDPPRSGMEKAVLDYLCRTKPLRIRLLSCDPVTNVRDLKFLVEAGYKIKRVFLLDFYPQTSHIESLCYLESE